MSLYTVALFLIEAVKITKPTFSKITGIDVLSWQSNDLISLIKTTAPARIRYFQKIHLYYNLLQFCPHP